MATAIRLSRGGSKKRPYYKIVVADSRSPRDGRFIERIGSSTPLLTTDDEKRVVLDVERAQHWITIGAQPPDRVARFLDAAGVKSLAARNNPRSAERRGGQTCALPILATAIRLSRGGSKKRPYYKIVVADSRSPRDGRFIERIGSYNPLLTKDDEKRVVLDVERAKHWITIGAQPTDRVARFLDAAGVKERAARNNPKKAEPGEKAKERAEERATKLAEAEAAKNAAETETVEVVAEAVEASTEA